MNRRSFLALPAAVAGGAMLQADTVASKPIPIGLNTYCLRALKWTDTQLLDYAAAQKLDAIFLQDSLDPKTAGPGPLEQRVREQSEQLGLHLETGGGGILPKSPDDFANKVKGHPV